MADTRRCGTRAVLAIVLASLCLYPLAPTTAFGALIYERVSVATGGVQIPAGKEALDAAMSADGRYVVFASDATSLVTSDTNGFEDIFRRDRLTGETIRVSVQTGGGQSNKSSSWPAISADGRFVVFRSDASNLVAGDNNGTLDFFIRDCVIGSTDRVNVGPLSREANNWGRYCSVSDDGRYVCFDSSASNLVDGDTNGGADIFVRDRVLGVTTRASVSAAGAQASGGFGVVSGNGRYVAFNSAATNVVPNDTNGAGDIFVRDLVSGTTEMVSVSSGGVLGDASSIRAVISRDGRYVAFESEATNLVANDTNGLTDVFVRDRVLHTTWRASVSSSGTQAISLCDFASISGDGRWVQFSSRSGGLSPEAPTGGDAVFLHDNKSGVTERIVADSNGGDAGMHYGTSAAGRFSVFDIGSSLVPADTNGVSDVYVADRGLMSTALTRSPLGSTATFTRKRGVTKIKLGVTLKDERGVAISGVKVVLQRSSNGTTGWTTISNSTTGSTGKVTKTYTRRAKSTAYYRWVFAENDWLLGSSTAKQKVVVK
ncbi:MAG: hypothetical protein HGB10_08410 [Coriobacteriia bacterium]|nr:hypothetical protein [Coriobacteriia bacterium]